jgi:hypothetical protein
MRRLCPLSFTLRDWGSYKKEKKEKVNKKTKQERGRRWTASTTAYRRNVTSTVESTQTKLQFSHKLAILWDVFANLI